MSTYPITIFLLLALIATTTFTGIRVALKAKESPNRIGLVPRWGDKFVDLALGNQVFYVALILGLWFIEDLQFADFGFGHSGVPTAISFLAGIAIYFVLIGIYSLLVRLAGRYEEEQANSYIAIRAIWPRSESKHSKLRAVLLINPFTEELIYRGFLVYYLGHLFDSVLLFSVVGVVICLAIHLYQGVQMLHFHALFCISAILILFSPLGLAACFGFHLAGDYYPITQLKRAFNVWRSVQQRERNAA